MGANSWEPIIGIEIHAQLNTLSKVFSSDSASFGGGDNENISPVSLALPGALPVLNEKVVDLSIKMGLALNCKVNDKSIFARKNYFYPDSPKGYQISQYDKPICTQGFVDFWHSEQIKRVTIDRAHIEEDAGKSIHHGTYSLINFNRTGVPLLEIVSAPEINSPGEAADYARAVRQILRYTNVCDGNLEEGSMRCDCNISIRKKGEKKLGTRVELKNINSFRFVEKALEYEISRQIDLRESGQDILQETRLYDSTKNKTFSMRTKEEAQDYRYFPDPDLQPVRIDLNWVNQCRETLPELPLDRAQRFINDQGLANDDAFFLTQEKEVADYFEETLKTCKAPKTIANWIKGELWHYVNEAGLPLNEIPIRPVDLGELINLIETGRISGTIAKKVFHEMWNQNKAPEEIIVEKGWFQISDVSAIEKIVEDVIASNPSLVEEYKSGKHKVLSFLVGQVMKQTKGKASPEIVNKLLKERLG